MCSLHPVNSALFRPHIFPVLKQPQSVLILVFCVTTPCCGLVSGYQRFEGTYYLHLEGRLKFEAVVLPKCWYLKQYTTSVSKVYHEAGDSRFLRNVHPRIRLKHAIITYNTGVQPAALQIVLCGSVVTSVNYTHKYIQYI
jgi:hypothetical protein